MFAMVEDITQVFQNAFSLNIVDWIIDFVEWFRWVLLSDTETVLSAISRKVNDFDIQEKFMQSDFITYLI